MANYWSLGAPLAMGLGAYGGERASQKMMEPEYEARQKMLKDYMRFMSDPYSAYRKDPGLLQMRRQRMGDLQSKQLAQTGGTRGGAYGRQLMREGSAFDRQALDNMARMYSMGLATTGPTAAKYTESGGKEGAGFGALGSALPTFFTMLGNM